MSIDKRRKKLFVDWPNSDASRFIQLNDIDWHVQIMGEGEEVLLLHGTGSATHSWVGLASELISSYRVVMLDLPGHGMTGCQNNNSFTLPGMAREISALLSSLRVEPRWVIGHSAGAAILAQMCLERTIHPAALISLNGALQPFGQSAAHIFSQAARFLARRDFVSYIISLHSISLKTTERMIRATGSNPVQATFDHYRRLVGIPGHVNAALKMMAGWDLDALYADLEQLIPPLFLVTCLNDQTVSPSQAIALSNRLPNSILKKIPELGHLGHEESPDLFKALFDEIVQIATAAN